MTFLYAKLIGAYELSEEEKATVLTDENLLMTVEITNRETIALDSKETVDVYKFYKLTSRKAYITVNGNGGFYVYTNRVEKFITDAQKVFALEDIEPTDKK